MLYYLLLERKLLRPAILDTHVDSSRDSPVNVPRKRLDSSVSARQFDTLLQYQRMVYRPDKSRSVLLTFFYLVSSCN
jgi:hypothetical protein